MLSRKTSDKAETIAAATETQEEERTHAWRIARNCYFHRIRILIKRKGNAVEVAQLLERVETNEAIVQMPDHHELQSDIADAQMYIAIERLWSF